MLNIYGKTGRFTVMSLALSALTVSAYAAVQDQEVERKPGWEQEEAAIRKANRNNKEKQEVDPGLGGKEQVSKLLQMMTERLSLSAIQQERINAILTAHGAELSGSPKQKKPESTDEYKELKEAFKQAREAEDWVQRKKIEDRLAALRHEQLSAKSSSKPDYWGLIDEIEKELTEAQIPEFRKLAEELGMTRDIDAGSKLKPKDYLRVVTGRTVGLKPEQIRKIEFIYRDTQEKAKEVASDRKKLLELLARMRADIRAVLDANQRRLVAQLLIKAEERLEKDSPASADEAPKAEGAAAASSEDDVKSLIPQPLNVKRDKETLGKRKGKVATNKKTKNGSDASSGEGDEK